MRLSDALQEFVLDRSAYCSPKTVAWYRYMLSSLSDRLVLEAVTSVDLREWISRERLVPGHSASSVAGRVRAAKAFFHWCVRVRYLESDPSVSLKAPRFERLPCSLSKTEIRELVAFVDASCKLRDRVLIRFLLDTGCRASETVQLDIAGVDLVHGQAEIIGKGNKRRQVALMSCVPLLREYLGDRKAGPVFISARGERLTRFGLREIFRRLGKRMGKRLFPHGLRHTFGTQAVASGIDLSYVQELMGHAQVSTTMVYVKSARRAAALEAYRRVSPLSKILEG